MKKPMRWLNVLGEILPVLGTVGLLGLWLFQQTQVERRASQLQRLTSAKSVFQTYQSHNAVFNAALAASGSPATESQIRTFQMYNYELGLAAIEETLPPSEKAGIPSAPDVYGSVEKISAKMAVTQKRLEQLQTKLREAEDRVRGAAESAKNRYLWMYIVLSLVSLGGAISKTILTLNKTPPSGAQKSRRSDET